MPSLHRAPLWRVLAVNDHTGATQLARLGRVYAGPCLPKARPGDLWQGHLSESTPDTPWQRRFAASGDFPHQDGDFARLHDRDSRRFQLLVARSVLLQAIRQFFVRRDFVEADTPAMAVSPGLELHLDAVRVQLRAGMAQGHNNQPLERWLVTSPEFHCKRLLAAGLEQVFSLQHAFRSGERSQWHNPEFAMLEWYRVGASYLDIVRDTQALVRHCAKALQQDPRTAHLLVVPPALVQRQSWPRWSIRQTLQTLAGFDPGKYVERQVLERALACGLDVRPGDAAADVLVQALVERVEPQLVHFPVLVLDRWPTQLASLAKRFDRTPHLAERFEIYVAGLELANGFTELTDVTEQRARFSADLAARQRLGRPLYPMDERFLAALAEGCPPAAGVALGVDRLLMALTGTADLDDVQMFPIERA